VNICTYYIALKDTSFQFPSQPVLKKIIKEGGGLFLFKGAASFYTMSNTIIIGFLCPIQYAGYYSAADKIIKALRGLVNPINRVLFPRLSSLVRGGPHEAIKVLQVNMVLTVTLSFIMGGAIFVSSPFVVKLVLGGGFEEVVPVLRVLALLLPIVAISSSLGIQWMVPLGLEWPMNRVIILAGLLNLGVSLAVVPFFLHMGSAWSVLLTEVFIALSLFLYLTCKKLIPARSNLQAIKAHCH